MTTQRIGVANIEVGCQIEIHKALYLTVATVEDESRPGKILVTFTDGRQSEFCKKRSVCILIEKT